MQGGPPQKHRRVCRSTRPVHHTSNRVAPTDCEEEPTLVQPPGPYTRPTHPAQPSPVRSEPLVGCYTRSSPSDHPSCPSSEKLCAVALLSPRHIYEHRYTFTHRLRPLPLLPSPPSPPSNAVLRRGGGDVDGGVRGASWLGKCLPISAST